MSAHHVRIKKDRKGKRVKLCIHCGCVCKKCDVAVEKKRKEIMKSAPASHKYYFGYISKSPLNAIEKQKKRNAEMAEEKDDGLLGQLKGMFRTRDGVVPRVYRHFEAPPQPQPYHICFDTLQDFAHREVMQSCKDALALVASVDGSKVVNIQLIPQKVFFCCPYVGDRWIIEISTKFGVKKLLEAGLTVRQKEVYIRPMDAVIMEEYRQFKGIQRMAELMVKPNRGQRAKTAPPVMTSI